MDDEESSSSKTTITCTKEHDRVLPIANVGRIMKKVIPVNGKVSKEAKETVQECVSEFISFVTGEASDKCQREKRKTINGDDIIWAVTILGFEDYVSPLKVYLNRYREIEGDKLNNNNNHNNNNNNNNSSNNFNVVKQEVIVRSSEQMNFPAQVPLQQLLHRHREQQRQQQYDQFLQIDQGLLPLEVANHNQGLIPIPIPISNGVEDQISFPFSESSSIQKNFHQHEQIDSQW